MKTIRLKYIALLISFGMFTSISSAQTVKTLFRSGTNGAKKNIVVIGDGFTTAEQKKYNKFVNDQIVNGLFSKKLFNEVHDAFNLFRINVDSKNSGITQIDTAGKVTTQRNTALGFRYSGHWNRCWMEPGPNSQTTMNKLFASLAPQVDFVIVILNQSGYGGCRRGNQQAVCIDVDWRTLTHEMGHMIANLGDEYFDCGGSNYAGTEPIPANLTRNTNRNTLKWREFVPANRAIPTANCGGGIGGLHHSHDAGLFQGATTSQTKFRSNLFRPADNCGMRTDGNDFCPVCYNHIQKVLKPKRSYDFEKVFVGDFTGNDHDEVLVQFDNGISLYKSVNQKQEHIFTYTSIGGNGWKFQPNDQLFIADFNGDGKDDLFVFNAKDWAMPYFGMFRSTGNGFAFVRRFDDYLDGWGKMKPGDQFFVADFNDDNKDDLYAFNATDWSTSFLGMIHSTGNTLLYTKHYAGSIPIWGKMSKDDRYYVADFNGDNKEDLYILNTKTWTKNYVGMVKSTGSSLECVKWYSNNWPGMQIGDNDEIYVADFDDDKKDDLYIFNGKDWSNRHLLMARSEGNGLSNTKHYTQSIPGWGRMAVNDKLYVGDMNGDGKDDLFIYNSKDWWTEFLGLARSTGNGLQASFHKDFLGNWNFGNDDKFLVGNFNGGGIFSGSWDDLFVHNKKWFGMLRSNKTSLTQTFICPEYIHDFNFHTWGWW